MKRTFFISIEMSVKYFDRLFFKVFEQMFQWFVFQRRRYHVRFMDFVNSRNFCSNIFLLSLMILWFSWRMIVLEVLLLLEKRGLTAPHTHKNTHRNTTNAKMKTKSESLNRAALNDVGLRSCFGASSKNKTLITFLVFRKTTMSTFQ